MPSGQIVQVPPAWPRHSSGALAGFLKTVTKSRSREKLEDAERVARSFEGASDAELQRLVDSTNVLDRIAAALLMQSRAERSETIRPYLAAAHQLIHDADNTCRWQALILVGAGIEREPELVWDVITEEGSSRDDDMRTGVATVLLEHLLDEHFETYFPMVRERVLSGDDLFTDTLSGCWLSDPSRKKRIASLVRNAKRGASVNRTS
jgi:hypothetical protein